MLDDSIFQATLDAIPNIIVITDGRELVKCNRAFLKFFAVESLEEFKIHHDCVCEMFVEHKDYFTLDMIDKDTLWTDYLYEHGEEHKVSMLDKELEPRAFEVAIERLINNSSYYVTVFTDITELQREKKLLEKMAYYDPLTDIYNRKMFTDRLRAERANQKRYNDKLSLIMLDIDHFKKINDTYGHDIGDKVLVTLARIVKQHLRLNDVFARWGGEEFMILLPRTDVDEAYKKAQQLRHIIEIYKDEALPGFTVSMGVTEILPSDEGMACYKRVDNALYKAKEKRNDVVKLKKYL